MGKSQKLQKRQDNTITRGEYRKVINNLADVITSLRVISDSLDKTATQQAQHEDHRRRLQTALSVVSLLIAIASAGISTFLAIDQFHESGPRFSYIAQVSGHTNKWTEHYNSTVTKHAETTPASILLSNTGRLKATVLSVSVEDEGKQLYNNLCTHQEVVIEPGETKLVTALFRKLEQPIAKVHVLTGDAQIIDAKKQDLAESDVAVQEAIDYAFRQSPGSKLSGQAGNSSEENTPIDPANDIVCLADPGESKEK